METPVTRSVELDVFQAVIDTMEAVCVNLGGRETDVTSVVHFTMEIPATTNAVRIASMVPAL